jgi:hypothetical protein
MTIKVSQFQMMINKSINKAIGGNLTAAQISTVLTNTATALTAVSPAPTRDRTIRDIGPALNPWQPN